MSDSSIIRRVLLTFWYTLAVVVVLGAVLLNLARIALPMVDEYRIELQAWASSNIGYPVEVESLDIRWRGFGPELQLENFRLLDESGRELLSAKSVGLGIDLLRSALAREPRLSVASIVGTDLSLVRLESGRIVLEGMEHLRPADNPLHAFLRQPGFEIRQSKIRWQDRGAGRRSWSFDRITFRMSNRGDRHSFSLKADLPVALGRQFEVVADMTGPGTEFTNWSGRVYVNGRELHIDRWMRTPLPDGVIVGAVVDAELWLDVQRGLVEEVSAIAGLHNVEVWSGDKDSGAFVLDRLGGAFLWQREQHGWRLDVNDLLVEFPGRVWPTSGGTLIWYRPDDTRLRVEAAADYLEVEPLVRLAGNLPFLKIPDLATLQGMDPRGVVRELRVGFEQPDHQWVIEAVVDNLQTEAHQTWPGISGLNGYVVGANDRGHLVVGGTDVSIRDPARFPQPLAIGVLDAEVNWSTHEGLLRFDVPLLEQYAQDVSLRARGRLDVPADGEPVLDVFATLQSDDIRAVNRYLPTRVMPPGAVKWLDAALVSGKISSGDLLFHGPLQRFPFRNNEGRFEARLNVSDAILDYRHGWPRIEELDAEVGFVNLAMVVTAEHGEILETKMVDVVAEISDLTAAPLEVGGKVRGPLSEMLHYVNESPLGVNYKRLLAAVSTEGNAELALDLNVPLRGPDRRIAVDGNVSLAGNRLDMKDWNLTLRDLQGMLEFDRQGLTAQRLDATLLEKPVQLSITQAQQDKRPVKRIRIKGDLPVIRHFRIDEILSIAGVQGESFWDLMIDVPKPAGPDDLSARVALESDLAGIRVDLPEPYGKSAQDRRAFSLVYEIDDEPARIIRFNYADLMTGVIQQDIRDGQSRFSRGELLVGEGVAELPVKPGLLISGHVPSLNGGNWLDWYREGVKEGESGAEKDNVAAEREPVLRRIALQVDDLQLLNQDFRDVAFEADRGGTAWLVNVESPQAAGRIKIPFAVSHDDPLSLDLEKLYLTSSGEPGTGRRADVDPGRVEPINLDVGHFLYKDLDLGQMKLVTRPIPRGVQVETLTLKPDWMNLAATGTWTKVEEEDESRFEFDIASEDFGELLEKFGYSAEMKGGEAQLGITAEWPGTPFDLAFENVEGNFDLKVGEGRLVDVEPGAGRLFGLLSLHSLQRRLTLDFSDLFKKGYTFDRIEGSFRLTESNAYTDDLFIDSPAARIEITGRAGLAAQDYDQHVTVIPHVSSTLPIAGAIAGGPAVGAALLLADKLLPEQMEKLTSFAQYHYSLTGTWEEPVLTRLSVQPDEEGGRGFHDTEDDG